MLEISKLRVQGRKELEALRDTLSREIYGLRCDLAVHRKLDQPHLLRLKKKNRARVLTVLRQQHEATDDAT